jgi:hypothetical protein
MRQNDASSSLIGNGRENLAPDEIPERFAYTCVCGGKELGYDCTQLCVL